MENTKKSCSTNQEIVDDLAKDFEEQLATNNKTEKGDKTPQKDKIFDEDEENDYECPSPDEDKDEENIMNDTIIDEEELKNRDENLTDDEKQKMKEEAQELKTQGNKCFNEENFDEAIKLYSQALKTCPLTFEKDRSILYSNRAAARSKLDLKEDAVMDCSKAIELNPTYLKALNRRAGLYKALEKLDEALVDYQKIVEIEPANSEARHECAILPEMINDRNEKLKTEMMGKLKDLGNLILRPFGLSTDNFNLQQDPNTGSYSVNFSNNPAS